MPSAKWQLAAVHLNCGINLPALRHHIRVIEGAFNMLDSQGSAHLIHECIRSRFLKRKNKEMKTCAARGKLRIPALKRAFSFNILRAHVDAIGDIASAVISQWIGQNRFIFSG